MPTLSFNQAQRMQLGQHQVQVLQQRQLQHLKMLQATRAELSQLLRQEADLNPALVVDDPAASSIDEARDDYDREGVDPAAPADEADPDFGVLGKLGADADELYADGGNNEYDPDAEERRQFFFDSIPATESLQAHLVAQLDERDLPPADRELAEQIVGSIGPDGRLETPLAEIAQAAFRPLADAERLLALVQGFSPTGVGARDLRECLLLQLRGDPRAAGSTALRLASDPEAFAMLERRDFPRIAARLGVSAENVAAAVRDLSALDPFPGRAFASGRPEFVRPDIVVRETEDGRFEAFLDEAAQPSAHLSLSWIRRYEKLKATLRNRANDRSRDARSRREARDWLADRLRAGQELLDGLSQRKATLLAVARSVVAHQQAYFREGKDALLPLTRAQVAAEIGDGGVDESTVSRAVAGKWVRSPQGVVALGSLFRSGVKTASGDTIAVDRVQARLRDLVAAEDPARPLSDQALADALAKEGLPIARRTVVKYRGLLGIPVASARRR